MTLQGKTALITGASSGIGRACALRFAEAGANLILCARSKDKLDTLKTEILSAHPTALVHVLLLDVQDKKAVFEKIAQLPPQFQTIDILINDAGLALGKDAFQECNVDDWDTMIDTNIKGLLYVSRAVVPGMLARQSGTVINVGSIAGRAAYPGGNVYAATKAAVRMISDSMRVDMVGTGVRVTDLEPGGVYTDFNLVRFKGDKEKAEARYAGYRALDPEVVADAALYVATAKSHVQIQELLITSTDQSVGTIVRRQHDSKNS